MIGGQGEDSCGKRGRDETPQEHKRRGGSSLPRKAKPCTEINRGITSGSAPLSHLFVFTLD
ncbi:hypothetical protein [Priestia megaterium]|uniref:hypothetical protein n=1 Tax=Priestia megaterium TaxID=1404 RepID=UPI0004AF0A11|nr:hypothetical protein [Priestia megaterium]